MYGVYEKLWDEKNKFLYRTFSIVKYLEKYIKTSKYHEVTHLHSQIS